MRLAMLAVLVGTLGACAEPGPGGGPPAAAPDAPVAAGAVTDAAAAAAAVAGYYQGDLPCADCPGIRYRLQLRPGGVFMLQTEYQGRGANGTAASARLGRWELSADGRQLTLRSPGADPEFFTVPGAGILRKLDRQGRPIDSRLNHDLRRQAPPPAFAPLLRLEGQYSYMADAGWFSECTSGLRLPVAQEAANAELERGYLAAGSGAGAPLLVTVDARLLPRPKMEGEGLQEALVVERFHGAWPGEGCGDPGATAGLLDTDWVLTRLGGAPVRASARGGGPQVTLRADGNRVEGFGGCNRFMGTFRHDGTALSFGRLAATMMACPDAMEQERRFLDALDAVAAWQVTGKHLELYDKAGAVVARFEARPAP